MTVFNTKEIEALFLIRDGLVMALDGVNRFLEGTEPKETELQYDLMKVVTRQTSGPNGVYLKAIEEDNQNNTNFELLLEDLKEHDNKLTKQGYFVWKFSGSNNTVGMKLSRK